MANVSQRIQSVIDGLHYDFNQFSLDGFIQHLEVSRKRAIVQVAYEFNPGLTGLWIPAQTADYIFYTRSTHPIHQVHIVLHEVAHMVLEHPCKRIDQILPASLVQALHLSDAVLTRIAGKPISEVEEVEAEAFVYLVQQHIVSARRLSQLTNGQSSIEGLNRFTDSLGLLERPKI
ncbi:MAG: hypothetical protein LCI00_15775 [Chloroflexi bacterium]|nr:hypothetical protein [Chloroflexota bacterium]